MPDRPASLSRAIATEPPPAAGDGPGSIGGRLQARLLALPPAGALVASGRFDAAFYAAVTGLSGTAETLAAHYLETGAAAGTAPSRDFSAADYCGWYADVPRRPADAFLHFVRHGQFEFRCPSRALAWSDGAMIMATGLFDFSGYAKWRQLEDRSAVALLIDYSVHGAPGGVAPWAGFEPAFVARLYGPLLIGHSNPLVFYLANRHRPWCHPNAAAAEEVARAVRASGILDEAFYRRTVLGGRTDIDPALHYASVGYITGAPAARDFDSRAYYANNPDIAAAEIDPAVHFAAHGRAEGRRGSAQPIAHALDDERESESDGPTILIVSHEASRSGAPFVALELVSAFADRANVVVWLGQDGPLRAAFARAAVDIVVAPIDHGSAGAVVDHLKARHAFDFALVNSVVAAPALPALAARGVPAVLMLHECADYVFPAGTAAAAVARAAATVVPAEFVAASVRAEFERLGMPSLDLPLVVRPQGRCDTGRQGQAAGGLTAAEIRARLGIDDDAAKPFVVFGAGRVQPRKGVELFIETAHQYVEAYGRDCRFVWVGGGYEPPDDAEYSLHLADQIAKFGLGDVVSVFGEQASLAGFWAVADAFLLSSRFDPYPNVVLDALWDGLPVVCFERTTGAADLVRPGSDDVQVVTFKDPAAAARALASLHPVVGARDRARRAETWRPRLAMADYAQAIFTLGMEVSRASPPPTVEALPRSLDERAWFAAAQPAWALADRRGPFRSDAELAADHALAIRRAMPSIGRSVAASPVVRRADARIVAPGEDLAVPPGMRAGLHVHLTESADPIVLLSILRAHAAIPIAVTFASRSVEERCLNHLATVRHVSIPDDPQAFEPPRALLRVLAAAFAGFDLVGSIAVGAPPPAVRGRAGADLAFATDRAAIGGILAALAAPDGPMLAFPHWPVGDGTAGCDRVAGRLAASLGRPERPRDDRPRPATWNFWLAPSRCPDLLEPALGAAAAGLVRSENDADRQAGFLAFLASLADPLRPMLAVDAFVHLRRAAPCYLPFAG
ncbi:glycosyltransferase [Prosthecodimorpha staleyi]|uniref:Glycosyltransferase n=1 Tax=Prosthecodimorpha staleyi TaxID=2840188 RepID=A0A947D5Y7_9HYPH|nr:glycosyltransferase [Prosthecodimorpha staleyi]MBT9290201.1 glycosyltransferase [Prosthecodimorpha staleyi]